jgi:hypothetical protein
MKVQCHRSRRTKDMDAAEFGRWGHVGLRKNRRFRSAGVTMQGLKVAPAKAADLQPAASGLLSTLAGHA